MSKQYQLDREMSEIEVMLQEWAAYKTGIEPSNPLQARAQKYKEFAGRSSNPMGSAVPVYALDMAKIYVPMVESLLQEIPPKMASAIRIYYASPGTITKEQRKNIWIEETGGNKDQYYILIENARWAIWGLLNPREIMRR